MDAITMIGLGLILVFGAVFGVFLFKDSGKGKDKKKVDESKKVDGKVVGNKKNEINQKDVSEFMEFDRIVDNMILQENERKYTMIIQCKGINYDLMSEIEQMAVEEGFITFLNTLKFPIQLYVQARAVDLKKSMDIYNNNVGDIEAKFYQADAEYKQMVNDFSTDLNKLKEVKNKRDRMAHILNYAQDITQYVERISLNKHVLQRKFYIALSYYKSEVVGTTEFSQKELHDLCYRELYTRAQSIISALLSCSVTGRVLTSNELAELLYISYNRDDEKLIDIRSSLESGIYRLYSTSKDVFTRKEEVMQQQVEEEARRRVKEAIYQTLNSQNVRTEEQLIEEFEERADREAINIINTADVPDDVKEDLTNIIAENHVEGVEQRRRERERRFAAEEVNNQPTQVTESNQNNENITSSVNNETRVDNVERNKDEVVVNKNLEISIAEREDRIHEENEKLAKETENTNILGGMNNNINVEINQPLFDDRLSGGDDDNEDEIIV